MTDQENGRPAPDDTERDLGTAETTKDLRALRGGETPDAETREAAKEAIDRATAAVGHDDGKR